MKNILSKYHLSVFYEFSYIEHFLEQYIDKYFCFSIADNQYYDNCERLFLPDSSSINGYKNNTTFRIRMGYIKDVLEKIIEKENKVELFIRDSGTELSEFDLYVISLDRFCDFTTAELNSIAASDLHLIITK